MKYKPHDYQAYATEFICEHQEAALFLQMGLGKTIITLTAIDELLNDYFAVEKVLIVAPLRVARDTWPQELQKWDHLKALTYSVLVGTPKQRRDALNHTADIYIINRENIPWLVKELGKAWPFDMVIIDELSSFKNHKAKRFKALTKVRSRIRRIVGLTGTPSSNGLLDLWAPFRLLDGGKRLGRFITHYRERFFRPGKSNGHQVYEWLIMPGSEEKIYELIGDITISMETADYLQLPEVTDQSHEVAMQPKEKALYDNLKRDMVVQVRDTVIDAGNAGTLSGKLMQLASGAIYIYDEITSEQTGWEPIHSAK
ncbi:SNF2-related protein [Corynebacterium glucuronolyticum]|nr:SNF2-related protein [Corynebacterium glucuronolyticum]